jgi:pyrroloquinoline quinone biosynthesis protein A
LPGRQAEPTAPTKVSRIYSQSTIWRLPGRVLNEAVGIRRRLEQEDAEMWTKPAFTDLRIGFEVTLYFANR